MSKRISTAPALKKDFYGESIGRSRRGLTSKIHVVTDGCGNAVHFILTEGGIHDSKQAENLLETIIHEKAYVLGDKGYIRIKLLSSLNKNRQLR